MTVRFGLAVILTLSVLNLANGQSQGLSIGSMSSGMTSRTLPGSVGGSSTGFGSQAGTSGTQVTRQAFVGASSQSIGDPIGSLQGLGNTGGFGGLGGLGGGFGLGGGLGGYGLGGGLGGFGMMNRNNGGFGNQYGNNGQNATRTVKAQLKLGIAVPVSAPATVARQFNRRIAHIPQLRDAGQVRMRLEGGTAILEGVVATDNDRNLMAQLVMLEPGIVAVRNELQVDPTAAPAADNP